MHVFDVSQLILNSANPYLGKKRYNKQKKQGVAVIFE
jgi:hypothetical protein